MPHYTSTLRSHFASIPILRKSYHKALQIKHILGRAIYKKPLNLLWSRQSYILANLPTVTKDLYESNKNIREFEHQVGRFLNMQEIARQIKQDNIAGDIVEFGTFQGMGLLLLNRCFYEEKNRTLIGIDSFEGLPESSTIWAKGQFNDTTMDLARRNIETQRLGNQPFKLIKGWFNDKIVAEALYKTTDNIALIHFDADLYSSTMQALSVIEPYLKNRTQPMYFLFDDWGCNQDEVPDAFWEWLGKASKTYHLQAEKISTTRLTRNYKITFHRHAPSTKH